MAELKTKVTNDSVEDFLNAIPDETRRKDSLKLLELYEKETGEKGKLWSTGLIGFGEFHYKSERSSQEGEWMLAAFAVRKATLTLYMMGWVNDKTLKSLGKCKKSGSCLHIKALADVDETILKKVIKSSYEDTKKRYNV